MTLRRIAERLDRILTRLRRRWTGNPFDMPVFNELHRLSGRPIDTLMLSSDVLAALKWEGITHVGDCLVFYVWDLTGRSFLPARLHMLMYGEVFEQIVARGYWRFIEDYTTWEGLVWGAGAHRSQHLALWKGKVRDLRRIPKEALGLSAETNTLLRYRGAKTVSHCVDTYKSGLNERGPAEYRAQFAAIKEELGARLQELGYLSRIEHPDSFV